MAEYGWFYCKKSIVTIDVIRLWTKCRPIIIDESRDTFTFQAERGDWGYDRYGPLRLTLYERDGKLIAINNFLFEVPRQTVSTIIGHFTDCPEITGLE